MPLKLPPWLTPTEDEDGQEYNGPLSTYTEWHALQVGFAVGFASFTASPRIKSFTYDVVGLTKLETPGQPDVDEPVPRRVAMAEARKEGWVAMTGMIAGALAAIALQSLAAYGVIEYAL